MSSTRTNIDDMFDQIHYPIEGDTDDMNSTIEGFSMELKSDGTRSRGSASSPQSPRSPKSPSHRSTKRIIQARHD